MDFSGAALVRHRKTAHILPKSGAPKISSLGGVPLNPLLLWNRSSETRGRRVIASAGIDWAPA